MIQNRNQIAIKKPNLDRKKHQNHILYKKVIKERRRLQSDKRVNNGKKILQQKIYHRYHKGGKNRYIKVNSDVGRIYGIQKVYPQKYMSRKRKKNDYYIDQVKSYNSYIVKNPKYQKYNSMQQQKQIQIQSNMKKK